MPTDLPRFPDGFRFGVSTSAFQIEGATTADGRGPSIWDTFSTRPGAIRHGETAEIAAHHYHRLDEDITHLSDAGVQDYRFSLSWSRIVPTGSGRINERGLDFYDRLVDALVSAGIRPVPTLYHWDLPQPLEDNGGWLARSTAERFAEYVLSVGRRLGDRVHDWITLNEMSVHTLYGYALTEHAPGRGLGLGALPAAHHQLLGHGLAVQALRSLGPARIGVASQHFPVQANTESAADRAAATAFADLTNWTFSDPMLLGRYPSEEIAAAMPGTPAQVAADLLVISTPLDFYGVNYYEPTRIEAPHAGTDSAGVLEVDVPDGLPFSPVPVPCAARTDFGWAIVPDGLRDILLELGGRYPDLPPLVITENGASFHDPAPDAAGRIRDDDRIRYLDAHLRAVAEAIDAGADVRGYYVWSLLDNFEWAAGYDERFGLVHVDFASQVRTRKDSWAWYRDTIARQGILRELGVSAGR